MLQRLRHRVQGQEGFTLIELLVVILIIGILAAVAIPTFLSQTSKADGSNVEASLNSAQLAMETYNTNNASYPATGSAAQTALVQVEPTLSSAFTKYSLAVTNTVSGNGYYTIVGKVPNSNPVTYLDLSYNPANGTAIRTCQATNAVPTTLTATMSGSATLDNKGDCSANATWGNG